MATSYKHMVKMLQKKYPGKHIEVGKKYHYFDHSGGYYKTEHKVFVEDIRCKFDIPTFPELEKFFRGLCEKEA